MKQRCNSCLILISQKEVVVLQEVSPTCYKSSSCYSLQILHHLVYTKSKAVKMPFTILQRPKWCFQMFNKSTSSSCRLSFIFWGPNGLWSCTEEDAVQLHKMSFLQLCKHREAHCIYNFMIYPEEKRVFFTRTASLTYHHANCWVDSACESYVFASQAS